MLLQRNNKCQIQANIQYYLLFICQLLYLRFKLKLFDSVMWGYQWKINAL